MKNLYWKRRGETLTLEPKPFNSETEFEQYIFNNQDILEDINIIHRQIRTGAKQGIPDMIGIDQNSRICIIEVKNVEATEGILPQALGYAVWAETNPDSLRAIWLESKSKQENYDNDWDKVDWDNIEIRVILVAPSFRTTVLSMAAKLGYPVDLIQVNRYSHEKEEFIQVEVLEKQPTRPTTTKVLEEWSWESYEKEHGKEATLQFKKMVGEIASFIKKNKWNLPYNLNKYYTGFKSGNKVVFSVHWASTHNWDVKLKISENIAKAFKGKNWEYQRYDNNFNEALFRLKYPNMPIVGELGAYLMKAYENVFGKKRA